MKTPTLWLGMWYGISGVSDGLFTTVALWAIQRTGTSPWLITLSGLSLVAPRFVLMYLGKLIDRSGPAPAFVVLNGLGLLTIGATILFSQHPVVVKGLVLGALFLITTLWQEVRLTGKAIVAAEASSAQKVKLNGRLFAVQNGCFLAGFGIAAVLFLYRDWFHAAMVIELGLLILGLFNLVPILQAPALRRSTHVPPSGSSPNLRYFFDTLKRLWRIPPVRWVLILALLANMSLAPLAVGLPTLVRSRIGAYGTLYSLISAARPVGNIIAVLGSELGAHYSALFGISRGGDCNGSGLRISRLADTRCVLRGGSRPASGWVGELFRGGLSHSVLASPGPRLESRSIFRQLDVIVCHRSPGGVAAVWGVGIVHYGIPTLFDWWHGRSRFRVRGAVVGGEGSSISAASTRIRRDV
ncbi:hypothetical protein [Sulfobacillus thermosulfidooxidans]|uniref:hypothetical protein n=1 Tax=Sulfobacillus thermosulfidooxidans TaxID=28034 RepID=UPI0002E4C482|nr:hypothetical protein [Sulfobacillus thermosulfidooxidans]